MPCTLPPSIDPHSRKTCTPRHPLWSHTDNNNRNQPSPSSRPSSKSPAPGSTRRISKLHVIRVIPRVLQRSGRRTVIIHHEQTNLCLPTRNSFPWPGKQYRNSKAICTFGVSGSVGGVTSLFTSSSRTSTQQKKTKMCNKILFS